MAGKAFPSLQPPESGDPIGLAGGMNTYQYVAGNPFKYTDRRGLDPTQTFGDSASGNPCNLSDFCYTGGGQGSDTGSSPSTSGPGSFSSCVTYCIGTPPVQATLPFIIPLISGGLPILPYPRSGLGGDSTGATSALSSGLSALYPEQSSDGQGYWAPTLNNPNAVTNTLGRALGRWAPYAGVGTAIFDTTFTTGCTLMCMALK